MKVLIKALLLGLMCLAAATVIAQTEKSGQDSVVAQLYLTPTSYDYFQANQDSLRGPFTLELGQMESGAGLNGCNWTRFQLNLVPAQPIILVPRVGYPAPMLPASRVTGVDYTTQVTLRPVQLAPPEQVERKPGLHFYVGQTVALDFSGRSPVNKPLYTVTEFGWISNPASSWVFDFHLGFYPRWNFYSNYDLPQVSAEPDPDEGWCECDTEQATPEFSVGASVARNIPLGNLGEGQFGIRPQVSVDLPISGSPVPGVDGAEDPWTVPGAVELFLPVYWQVQLHKESGEKTGSTLILAAGPTGQFAPGSNQGMGFKFFGAIPIDTGIGWK